MKRTRTTRFQRAQSSQLFGQSAKDRKPFVAKADSIIKSSLKFVSMMPLQATEGVK